MKRNPIIHGILVVMLLLLIGCGTSNESNNATDMERTLYVSLNNLNRVTINVLEETISSLGLKQ